MTQKRRGRGLKPPRATVHTTGWALLLIATSASTFPVWLSWHFLEGPGAGRWLGALVTLTVAAVLGLRHLSPRVTWLLMTAPLVVVGWWMIATDPSTLGRKDVFDSIGMLFLWPFLAIALSSAVVAVVRISGAASWRWAGWQR